MKMRFFSSVSAVLFFSAAPFAAAGGVFVNALEEFFYDPPTGVSKVPWVGSCNDFERNHSDDERRRTVDMGALAEAAYQDGTKPPAGYSALSPAATAGLVGSGFSVAGDGTVSLSGVAAATGFDAVLYRNDRTGEITVAFRGTQLTSPGDLLTDVLQLGTGTVPSQYKAAADLLRKVLAATDGPVAVTGHSLGGGLAQYAIALNSQDSASRLSGYTFNSAGLSHAVVDTLPPAAREAAAERMTNVRNDGDSVSFFGCHLGTIYDVPNDGFFAHSCSIINKNLVSRRELKTAVEELKKRETSVSIPPVPPRKPAPAPAPRPGPAAGGQPFVDQFFAKMVAWAKRTAEHGLTKKEEDAFFEGFSARHFTAETIGTGLGTVKEMVFTLALVFDWKKDAKIVFKKASRADARTVRMIADALNGQGSGFVLGPKDEIYLVATVFENPIEGESAGDLYVVVVQGPDGPRIRAAGQIENILGENSVLF